MCWPVLLLLIARKMGKTFREVMFAEFRRLGIHGSLRELIMPERGRGMEANNASITLLARVLAGHIRDQLREEGAGEASPSMMEKAVDHFIGREELPVSDGDLTANEEGVAVASNRKEKRFRSPKRRKRPAAAALGAPPAAEAKQEDRDSDVQEMVHVSEEERKEDGEVAIAEAAPPKRHRRVKKEKE